MECKICYEKYNHIISYENKNLDYCIECFNYIINNHYNDYIHKINTCT